MRLEKVKNDLDEKAKDFYTMALRDSYDRSMDYWMISLMRSVKYFNFLKLKIVEITQKVNEVTSLRHPLWDWLVSCQISFQQHMHCQRRGYRHLSLQIPLGCLDFYFAQIGCLILLEQLSIM